MYKYLKKIGVGKERWKDLTYEEAFEANKKILNAEATDIQIGAFWGVMRVKYANIEELKGFIDSLREETHYIETDEFQPLDLGVGYDGKDKSIHILPAAIFIAAGAGAKIVGHGNERVPSKFGLTYHEVLKAMECDILFDTDEIAKSLELSGFAFYHQKIMNPKLASLLPKRQEFYMRTYLNTIEKLLNPFKTTKIIVGVAHSNFIDKYIQLCSYVGFKDIFVIRGLEGGIEPFPNRETKVCTNKIFSVAIRPKDKTHIDFAKEVSPEENAEICISVLKNEENVFKDWAIMTAGVLLLGYGLTDNITDAVHLAEESLNTNAAYECFEIYRSLSKKSIS